MNMALNYNVLGNIFKPSVRGLAIGYPATGGDNGDLLKYHFMYKYQCGNIISEYCGFTSMLNYNNSNQFGIIAHTFDQTQGQSGGPFIINHTTGTTIPTTSSDWYNGISGILTAAAGPNNLATLLTPSLANWIVEPPPNVAIDIHLNDYINIEWNEISGNTFTAQFSPTGKKSKNQDIESNLYWTSDLNGVFGTGSSVSAIDAKSILRSGEHVITLEIDTPDYSGYDSVIVTITGPEGSFNMASEKCIVDLSQSSNSCIIPITWQTSNAPDALVYNNRNSTVFSNNPQGSNVPFAAVHNQDTELVLYASQDKIYDIDRANLSAKLPTGTLTKNSSVCSLQPSPVNPHTGQFRDPKATPPGCGAVLSWSNVKWASPSIFYKPISGKGEWQFLYQIPCTLDGSVCNGSINTDEVSPELIPTSGVEFKLLQFNNSKSGVLTLPFLITAHRFADSYEFDDGDLSRFNYPNGTTDGFPSSYQFDNTYSNSIELDTIQNHNFHSPAAYDSNIDIDTVQVPINVLGDFEVGQGHQLSVTVSNMAPGLDVGFAVECAGIGIDTNLPEPIHFEGSYSFVNSPIISNIYNPINNSRTIKFQLKKNTTINNNGHTGEMHCLYNRVVISRISGTPSESLTYSVTVSEVVQSNGVTWANKVGVTTTSTSITKTGAVGWNAGATSIETLTGNGYLEFTKGLNKAVMIGLSKGNSSSSYTDIDYAIYLNGSNTYSVYESGAQKADFGSFTATDIFRVQVVGSTIKYLKNGSVFYTSTKPISFPLNIDTSLHYTNSVISNISLYNN